MNVHGRRGSHLSKGGGRMSGGRGRCRARGGAGVRRRPIGCQTLRGGGVVDPRCRHGVPNSVQVVAKFSGDGRGGTRDARRPREDAATLGERRCGRGSFDELPLNFAELDAGGRRPDSALGDFCLQHSALGLGDGAESAVGLEAARLSLHYRVVVLRNSDAEPVAEPINLVSSDFAARESQPNPRSR
jgi:hypothetical protein